MSWIIFLISSFEGSKPSARMATWGPPGWAKTKSNSDISHLELLGIDRASTVGIEEVKSFSDLLLLLLSELRLARCAVSFAASSPTPTTTRRTAVPPKLDTKQHHPWFQQDGRLLPDGFFFAGTLRAACAQWASGHTWPLSPTIVENLIRWK
jgi:hypothetical protein